MTSAYEAIRYDGADADGTARITLHRPERLNAFTNLMQRELYAAFDAVDTDPEVRAVVVTGSGRAFCAGADLRSGERTFSGGKRSGRDPGGVVAAAAAPDAREGVAAFRDRRAPAFAMRFPNDLPAAYPWWDPDEWSN
jgi:enoyl-CoA hydratase/carnithine racemase